MFCENEVTSKRVDANFCSSACSNKYHGKKRMESQTTWNLSKDNMKTCQNCQEHLSANKFSRIEKFNKKSLKKDICKKCSNSIREQERRDRLWQDDARQILIYGAKQRAKRSNILFNLSKEDIVIPDTCPVLGIPIERYTKKRGAGTRNSKENSPSIDRIDNQKGYTKDNIVVVSFRANRLKSDAAIDEIEKICNFYKSKSA